MTIQNRIMAAMMGLAVGDALGTTLEFSVPGSFTPIDDMVGGGPFYLNAGEWTDDTSMALCLADSFIQCKKFDPYDQMRRYSRWYRQGYLSSNGWCFDIGVTTRNALELFQKTNQPFSGPVSNSRAGNGSLMRLVPVAIFFHKNLKLAVEMSGESSRTTHGAPLCVDACRLFALFLVRALNGFSKEEVLQVELDGKDQIWQQPLADKIVEIGQGSYRQKQPPEIEGSGYVVKSLEAALWAFYHSQTFADGALLAVNLGDDADTTGAIYGQLAGAYYGYDAIPRRWLEKIKYRQMIEEFAKKLWQISIVQNLTP